MNKMKYRLAIDLGSSSIGWAMLRLKMNALGKLEPCAIIKTGVRIFSDGRNPKDGSSLAVTRREARAQRRRRDRLLKRKSRMLRQLTEFGFFPSDAHERKILENLNPYQLRAKGLDHALTPHEFGRALFHINQRRGFRSNRKTDKKENDSGALKAAIKFVASMIDGQKTRTIGEWLHQRMLDGKPVRARYRETKVIKEDGKSRIDKSYDLYIDRSMVEAEFEALWQTQASINPTVYNDQAKASLKDTLLYQRNLRPVKPGRCTLIPTEERAPLALPSTQRFRIYQEVNNLRILREGLKDEPLTFEQRNKLVKALEQSNKCSFTSIKKLLDLSGQVQFNFEDPKRQELKGNTTSASLSKPLYFGASWFEFDAATQDEIVYKLLNEENESSLVQWLMEKTQVDEHHAEHIANASLPEGFGALSQIALHRILPELEKAVITYDKAVIAAGFDHHSNISPTATGELLMELPYYGEALQRHVGFGSGEPTDPPEKRFGKIANPTVHIGLNQVRKIVNALIAKYGLPSEVIVEVARDLKQSKKQRDEENKRQAENQKRNDRIRQHIAGVLEISEERVRRDDLQKWILWEELSFDPADRKCPYSGITISAEMLLSNEVEIEHILPYSRTLDDSLNNKTVSLRQANRIKANLTPWEAFGKANSLGVEYADILLRAQKMPKAKRYRFAEDGMEQWDKDGKGFLARALNDTRYLSRIAREYLSLICPHGTRVIPGQMTAKLRGKLGLNSVLSENGDKNRNDHRHHAVDACVIGITDQGLLQRFAEASKSARQQGLERLVENMPDPWPTYREQVKHAIQHIYVSHKPDHNHEGAMHNDTAYGLLGDGRVSVYKIIDNQRKRVEEKLNVIPFTNQKAAGRHGYLPNGELRPYKGYKGDSNYCIEIIRNEKGKWESEVISTFQAYQTVRTATSPEEGLSQLRHPAFSLSGKPLIMRLMINDIVRLKIDGLVRTMRVATLSGNGQVFMCETHEANVDSRNRDKQDQFKYVSKMAGSFQKANARKATISLIGELRDHGFKG
jgi:CRISPR-associated endonuclease Csn1